MDYTTVLVLYEAAGARNPDTLSRIFGILAECEGFSEPSPSDAHAQTPGHDVNSNVNILLFLTLKSEPRCHDNTPRRKVYLRI